MFKNYLTAKQAFTCVGVGVALGYVLNLNREEIKKTVNNIFGTGKKEADVENVDIPLESLFEEGETEYDRTMTEPGIRFFGPIKYDLRQSAYRAMADALALIDSIGYVTVADLKTLHPEQAIDTNESDNRYGWCDPDLFCIRRIQDDGGKWIIIDAAPTLIPGIE